MKKFTLFWGKYFSIQKIPLVCIILLICSCNRTIEIFELSSLDYQIDTVIINPKDEILFLKFNLLQSDIGENETYLYNFNLDKHQIERINLDSLELEDVYPMEKEGPNGIGTNIWIFNHYKNDTFFVGSFEKNGIVNLRGEKSREIKFDMFNPIGDKISGSAVVTDLVIHPKEENIAFALFNDYKEREITFCKIELDTNVFKIIDLPEHKQLSKHYIRLNDQNGKIQGINGPAPYMDLIDNQLLISNSIDNLVYLFDIDNERLEIKRPSNKLFNFSKKEVSLTETDSRETYFEQLAAIREDISFGRITWDSKTKTFYRFSSEEFFDREKIGQGPIGANVYLSVFDSRYNLISEMKIDSLLETPVKYFAKNNMVWIFKNLEDEMGFIRMNFN